MPAALCGAAVGGAPEPRPRQSRWARRRGSDLRRLLGFRGSQVWVRTEPPSCQRRAPGVGRASVWLCTLSSDFLGEVCQAWDSKCARAPCAGRLPFPEPPLWGWQSALWLVPFYFPNFPAVLYLSQLFSSLPIS